MLDHMIFHVKARRDALIYLADSVVVKYSWVANLILLEVV